MTNYHRWWWMDHIRRGALLMLELPGHTRWWRSLWLQAIHRYTWVHLNIQWLTGPVSWEDFGNCASTWSSERSTCLRTVEQGFARRFLFFNVTHDGERKRVDVSKLHTNWSDQIQDEWRGLRVRLPLWSIMSLGGQVRVPSMYPWRSYTRRICSSWDFHNR